MDLVIEQSWQSMRRNLPPFRTTAAVGVGALAVASMLFPAMAPYLGGVGIALVAAPWILEAALRRPRDGDGIYALGLDRSTGADIWRSRHDMSEHMLVLGHTGSGKTEALLGVVYNALATGSGAIYMDGKGDISMFAKMHALAKAFGREDDLMVVNLLRGHDHSLSGRLPTNSYNPFAAGEHHVLAQILLSMLDEHGNEGTMWRARAAAMITALMRALCWMRDAEGLELHAGTIRNYLSLKAIIDLGDAHLHPTMPDQVRRIVKSYLRTLPGYVEEKGGRQSQVTIDQHGYLEMQFARALGTLVDVYGHVFATSASDVDLLDVYRNRRILIVMMPALEKAHDEIARAGGLFLSGFKIALGEIMSSSSSVEWRDPWTQPPNPAPFYVVLDDVPYYLVDGMSMLSAQARALGVVFVHGAQDINELRKLNEREGEAVIANTGAKVFLRQEALEEDGEESIRYGVKAADVRGLRAGEAVVHDPKRSIKASMLYADVPRARSHGDLAMNELVPMPKASRVEQGASE